MIVWDAISEGLWKRLDDDPSLAVAVSQKWDDVAKWSSVVTQGHGRINLVDKLVACELAGMIEQRGGIVFTLPVGSTPRRDDDEAGNTDSLRGLVDPFHGSCVRDIAVGLLTADGIVSWDEPITLDTHGGSVTLSPGSVPLEIGSMESARCYYAGISERGPGLARWPYGDDRITVILPPHIVSRLAADMAESA